MQALGRLPPSGRPTTKQQLRLGFYPNPDFTDEEVLIIYLFGLIRDRETIKAIHECAEDHFPE